MSEKKYIEFVGVILIVVTVIIIASTFYSGVKPEIDQTKIKKFSSYEEFKKFLEANKEFVTDFGSFISERSDVSVGSFGLTTTKEAGSGGAEDYSRTNIQIMGVDEADIVKNDGKYIYNIVGNKIVIVDAFPANEIKILSEIKIDESKNVRNIFVNGDKLVVFAEAWAPIAPYGDSDNSVQEAGAKIARSGISAYYPGDYGKTITNVYIFDISDREKPELSYEISVDGNYVNSRMIGNYVYVISSSYVGFDQPILPFYRVNGIEKQVLVGDISYFDYFDNSYSFNIIGAINLEDGEFSNEVYLTGGAENIFVSRDNIYLVGMKKFNERDYILDSFREVVVSILSEDKATDVKEILDSNKGLNEKIQEIREIIDNYSNSLKGAEKAEFDKKLYEGWRDYDIKIRKEREKSIVHKINVNKNEIEYKRSSEVSGHVLNQFSMDEFEGYFRIATTIGEIWEGNSVNNVYVFDENLKIIGKLEDLAKGERIYSTRFIGERAYLVTFKKTDPFFVIDLKDVSKPKVLGYLKIPGYSDYLHPYDEDHIIGVGKETVEVNNSQRSREFDFAWYQGLKISIFDVSDVSEPKESAKIVIGDRGTDSYALQDHKAFLFDKKRNLLVLPVSLAEIDKSQYTSEIPSNAYGEVVWQGAYVLNIELDSINVRGKITHFDDVVKYRPAKDESIGAKRKDFQGYIWTKVSLANEANWKIVDSPPPGYENVMWADAQIDQQPGGINYNPIYDYEYQIQRSLYMDDILYTVSQKKIKANELNDLEEVGKVELPFEGYNVVISA